MEVSIDLNRSQSLSLSLYYSPTHEIIKSNFFFQHVNQESPVNVLPFENIKTILSERKIELIDLENSITFFDLPKGVRSGMVVITLIITLLVLAIFTILIPLYLKDPVSQRVPICNRDLRLYDTLIPNSSASLHNVYYPCYMTSRYLDSGNPYSNLPVGIAPYLFTGILSIASSVAWVALYYYHRKQIFNKNELIARFNENLDMAINRLSYVNDLKKEIPARDIGIIFPYLPNDYLNLLNFSQLRSAKKKWKNQFQKKLDDSLFSKKQLSVWRLFEHLIKANPARQTKILSQPFYQEIIQSEPLFFQEIIHTFTLINKNDKRVSCLCEIAKKMLNPEHIQNFNKCDLESIILAVSKKNKLKDVIKFKIEHPHTNSFSELQNPRLDLMEDLEKKFHRFLDTGKLKIQDFNECYKLLKISKDLQKDDIANWLETYLSENLDQFLKDCDLSKLLDEIIALNMDSFKVKIDQYQQTAWGNLDEFSFIEPVELAKKYGLEISMNNLKNLYTSNIQNCKFSDDGKIMANEIIYILNETEKLFGEETPYTLSIIKCLEEKVDSLLKASPYLIEGLADTARDDQNEWLLNLIKIIYQENPTSFSGVWLSPFEF